MPSIIKDEALDGKLTSFEKKITKKSGFLQVVLRVSGSERRINPNYGGKTHNECP